MHRCCSTTQTIFLYKRYHKFLNSWPLTCSLFGKMAPCELILYIGFQSKRHEKLVTKSVKTRLHSVRHWRPLPLQPTLAHIQTTLRNLKTIMLDSWSKVQTVLDITGLWLTARQRDEDKDDGWVNSGGGGGRRGEALPWRCRARGGDGDKIKLSMPLWVDISITNSSPCHRETKASPQGDVIRRACVSIWSYLPSFSNTRPLHATAN